MKTIRLSKQDMSARTSYYADLKPLPIQEDNSLPQEAKDLIYARKLKSVIGLETKEDTPINVGAPIIGAGGMTITLAECPPGQGPSLHAHLRTYETFTVLDGVFEFSWNDDGSDSVILRRFDTVSIPPRVNRAFKNVGDADGVLQVIITGGVHDMNDIELSPVVGDKLSEISKAAKQVLIDKGFAFNAHEGADE